MNKAKTNDKNPFSIYFYGNQIDDINKVNLNVIKYNPEIQDLLKNNKTVFQKTNRKKELYRKTIVNISCLQLLNFIKVETFADDAIFIIRLFIDRKKKSLINKMKLIADQLNMVNEKVLFRECYQNYYNSDLMMLELVFVQKIISYYNFKTFIVLLYDTISKYFKYKPQYREYITFIGENTDYYFSNEIVSKALENFYRNELYISSFNFDSNLNIQNYVSFMFFMLKKSFNLVLDKFNEVYNERIKPKYGDIFEVELREEYISNEDLRNHGFIPEKVNKKLFVKRTIIISDKSKNILKFYNALASFSFYIRSIKSILGDDDEE